MIFTYISKLQSVFAIWWGLLSRNFACKCNEPELQPMAKLIISHEKILRVIFPLYWFTKFILVSTTNAGDFKLLSVIYFQYK